MFLECLIESNDLMNKLLKQSFSLSIKVLIICNHIVMHVKSKYECIKIIKKSKYLIIFFTIST